MEFEARRYQGQGVNHEGETFDGVFLVEPIEGTPAYRYSYQANRASDGARVHFETGLIGLNEDSTAVIHVQMDELPCVSLHALSEHSETTYRFAYEGHGSLAGFVSELVFRFHESGFRLTHRWALNDDLQDRSWCDLDAD